MSVAGCPNDRWRVVRRIWTMPILIGVAATMLPVQAPQAARETTRPTVQAVAQSVALTRTTDGIPHVRAGDWNGLGFGVGYAQAQDALCTLADAFVTYEGRRSVFFGPDAKPERQSTFGRQKNLDLDFFFRAFADTEAVARYRVQQPQELNELIEGYAAGYNRYLADARKTSRGTVHQHCLRQAWVREIGAGDTYRRLIAAGIAAGYSRFIPEIVNAQPGGGDRAGDAARQADAAALRAKLALRVGEQAGLGSNMIAFGAQATGGDGSVLFGNPHWYWGGPDRLYQMHLTLPGKLDVAGVSFLGVPLVMIGFNQHVAWSHTVSEARRFGLFELTLDPADPTRYRVDGVSEPMQARTLQVEVRGKDGALQTVTRTLYRSRFGPIVDLGAHERALAWGGGHALALRDVNAENFRAFRNFFYWNQARSLDDFMAIQRREAAVPWTNTAAIGRGDGRVWYSDVGAVPNVPDTLRSACATEFGRRFAAIDALTPFLDGSRSACNWRVDAAAAQAGAMPQERLPSLLREDYVANMNDSYWLSNPRQPLEGYASELGGERQALSLRGRYGHLLAVSLVHSGAQSARALADRVMHEVLIPRAYSAELFKEALLERACAAGQIELPGDPREASGGEAGRPYRKVNVAQACRILRRWPNTADAQDRGALLWDAFWAQLEHIPEAEFYRVPFSPESPLLTPREPNAADPRVTEALGAAVLAMSRKGWALDEALGRQLFVRSAGRPIPLYGGCEGAGYFVVACNRDGSYRMRPTSVANTYLQVVRFDRQGVEAYTLLAHGQQEFAVDNGQGGEPVARYARKAWLRFPFSEQDIARDAQLTRLLLYR